MTNARTPANIALLGAILILSAVALIVQAGAVTSPATTAPDGPTSLRTPEVGADTLEHNADAAIPASPIPGVGPGSGSELGPGAASTSAPTADDGDQPLTTKAKAEQALAMISYPWEERLPEWDIRFVDRNSGPYGLTFTRRNVIEVYVRHDQSVELLAHVIAHELGHAVDVSLNSGGERRRWQEARQITDRPWWPESGKNDFSSGAGDFAEAFAVWQTGPDYFQSELGTVPSTGQRELLEELAYDD